MSEIDVEGLRATAEKATPGVWKLWGMTVMADQDGTSNVDTAVEVAATFYRDERGKPRTFDANHIVAFGPSAALALLDALAAAERKVVAVEAEIATEDFPEVAAGRVRYALREPTP